jgi:methenyltetrahydrofolate cyclohydrolase
VPLQTAMDCLMVLELIGEVAGRGNPGASSDLGVGNLHALAGLTGAAYNVRINLQTINDEAVKADLSSRIMAIQEEGQHLFEDNREVIEQYI